MRKIPYPDLRWFEFGYLRLEVLNHTRHTKIFLRLFWEELWGVTASGH